MEANKIILPKTNPETVLKYAEDFQNKVRASKEYQKAERLKDENDLIDYLDSTYTRIAIMLVIFAAVFYFKAEGTRFIASFALFLSVATTALLIFGFAGLLIKKCINQKYIERFWSDVKSSGFYYYISDIFEPVSEDNSWYWRWYRDIKTLKKCAGMDGVTYALSRTTHSVYNNRIYTDKVFISCIKDGNIIYKHELLALHDYTEESLEKIEKTPGTLDFSCYDEDYWDDYTPYYEPGFEKDTNKFFIS